MDNFHSDINWFHYFKNAVYLFKAVKTSALNMQWICKANSLTHLHHSLLPAADYFLFANFELEGLVPITRGVELASICQGA